MTIQSFPHLWLITGLVTILTRRVPLVEQELLTCPEHLRLPPVCCGVRVTRSLVFCVCFIDHCLSFFLFLLVIVLTVLLWFTSSNYPNCSYKMWKWRSWIALAQNIKHWTFKLFLNFSDDCVEKVYFNWYLNDKERNSYDTFITSLNYFWNNHIYLATYTIIVINLKNI